MNPDFRISVVTPTYNRAHLIGETIASALAQTFPAHEIVVVDDGSTDGTEEVVRQLAAGQSVPIRYMRQKNAGPGAARNRGIAEANGAWIALLDSDDLWMPGKLAWQVEFLQRHPAVDFLFAHLGNFKEGDPIGEPDIPDPEVNAYCQANAPHLKEFFRQLLVLNFIPTSSVIFRREAALKVGAWREDLRCAEDYDWWLRWALLFHCGFLDRMVERRRIHKGNIIGDRILMLESTLRVLEELAANRGDLDRMQRAHLEAAINRRRYDLASEFYFRKDYAAAGPHLRRINPARLPSPVVALKWLGKLALTWRAGRDAPGG